VSKEIYYTPKEICYTPKEIYYTPYTPRCHSRKTSQKEKRKCPAHSTEQCQKRPIVVSKEIYYTPKEIYYTPKEIYTPNEIYYTPYTPRCHP
jgi:hypothetical protein